MITNDKKLFEKVYIPYAPGDNGGALGAAFVVSMKYNNEIHEWSKNKNISYMSFRELNDRFKLGLTNIDWYGESDAVI